jgi:hypothetical protein
LINKFGQASLEIEVGRIAHDGKDTTSSPHSNIREPLIAHGTASFDAGVLIASPSSVSECMNARSLKSPAFSAASYPGGLRWPFRTVTLILTEASGCGADALSKGAHRGRDVGWLADRDVLLTERRSEKVQHEGVTMASFLDLPQHRREPNGCGHGGSPTRRGCRVLMVVGSNGRPEGR